jgi:hypothetical protein
MNLSDRDRALLERLYALLQEAHAHFGHSIARVDEFAARAVDDFEIYPVGPSGVLAFFGDYVLGGWPPDEQRAASRDAYAILLRRLDRRGFTRHMVHPMNFRSVRLTRKLGAKPIGVDADGYVHYILTRERFGRHGKEVAAAEGT